MATAAEWIEGARPRTLPAAVAPVLAGTASALLVLDRFTGSHLLLVVLCAVVALALQVGVNFANDYSDGIRGTDDVRVGPLRLVGSGAAAAATVRSAAVACFVLAALAGLAAVSLTQTWWLLLVGVAAIAAAWFYTGGRRPYGYLGLGELFVFVFFGLVAVCGTHLLLTGGWSWTALALAVAIGLVACMLLVANNLRDLEGDAGVGKRTLATRLGERATRILFMVFARLALVALVAGAALGSGWLLTGLAGGVPLLLATRRVTAGAQGRELIGVLKLTGIAELVMGAGLLAGALVARVV